MLTEHRTEVEVSMVEAILVAKCLWVISIDYDSDTN